MYDIRMSDFKVLQRNENVRGGSELSILERNLNYEFIYGIERLMQIISIRIANALWPYMNGLVDKDFPQIAHHVVASISDVFKKEQTDLEAEGYVYDDYEYLISLNVSAVDAVSRIILIDVTTKNQALSFEFDFYRNTGRKKNA